MITSTYELSITAILEIKLWDDIYDRRVYWFHIDVQYIYH